MKLLKKTHTFNLRLQQPKCDSPLINKATGESSDEEDERLPKGPDLASILSRAPPSFPWLYPTLSNNVQKDQNDDNSTNVKRDQKITTDSNSENKKLKAGLNIEDRIPSNENELDLSIDTENDEFLGIDDEIAKEILADIDKEETEAIARKRARKAAKRLKREKKERDKKKKLIPKSQTDKNGQINGSNEENTTVKRKHKQKKAKKHKRKKENDNDDNERSRKRSEGRNAPTNSLRRSLSQSKSRSRTRSRSHSISKSKHKRKRTHAHRSRRSSSRTYSSSSNRSRSHSRSRSRSPLPKFSQHRAMETRRRIIEQSWHRRIEHSVRPCPTRRGPPLDISPIRTKSSGFSKADYMDEKGNIDKQKLLDIATRNATKLAMEGKLPKGAELIDTIKHKSIAQLVELCKKLQKESDLLPKGSSSDEDEDRRYYRKYNEWSDRRDRSTDREFRNHAVRTAAPERNKYAERERREIKIREDNSLRLTFPVSSGVQHRKAANEPLPELTNKTGALVRYGQVGPLTTALAKVRTSIPAAYRPLSQPLVTSQPTSSLSTHFESTSLVPIGPAFQPIAENKSPPPDIVSTNAYKIAVAAMERTAQLEKEKTKEPVLATSSEFIGPVIPKPTAADICYAAAATEAANIPEITNAVLTTSPSNSALVNAIASSSSAVTLQMPEKKVFSSSWDKPGHVAAREALIRKIAEQKRQAEEAAAREAKEKEKMEAEKEKQQQLLQNEKSAPAIDPHISSADADKVVVDEQQPTTSSAIAKESLPNETINNTNCLNSNAKLLNAQQQPSRLNLLSRLTTAFVPSRPMLLPTTSSPGKSTEKAENESTKDENNEDMQLMDKVHAYVETQVARQKAESILHVTILSAQLHQNTPPTVPKNELSTFAIGPASSKDPIGLTKPEKSIQELVADRLRYSQRLQRDPNDYETRKALAKIEEQMSKWAQDSTLPGEFTGHTGARVLSEKELEPIDPRFHAWAKKDQFRNAPEVSSGIGMRLMERMGWRPGQGLGKDKAGPVEPLALDVKSDRRGFYSEDYERVPKRESILDPEGKNPVSVLMEVCSHNHWSNPQFHCLETGPHNNRRYHWKAILNGVEYSPSLPSSNKKAGKAQVCMVVLEALGLTS